MSEDNQLPRILERPSRPAYDKVDRWRTSNQKQYWLAAALLDIEPRLRRIKGLRPLPLLRQALLAEAQGKASTAGIRPA